MSDEIDLPEISLGARSLLRIARTNDVHRAMARNAALLAALEFGQELMQACSESSLRPLFSLLQTKTPPKNFLAIAAATLRCIRARTDKVTGLPAVRDFDRHVLQGFAEAVADIAWPDRDAQDFDGPSPRTFITIFSRHDLETLWTGILQNYLANIFLDYFAALRVREEVTDLGPTVESDLRLIDARQMAEHAMRIANEMGGEDDPAIVAFSLDQVIDKTLGVKRRDD